MHFSSTGGWAMFENTSKEASYRTRKPVAAVARTMRHVAFSCWLGALIVGTASGGITSGLGAAHDSSPPEGKVHELVEQLGSRDYTVRRRAENQLRKLGVMALDALIDAEDHLDLEIATRAGYLAQGIEVPWSSPDDPPEVQAALHDYAWLSPKEKEDQIAGLVALPYDLCLPALCRIVRFERSHLVSRIAATEVLRYLDREPASDPSWKDRAQTIERILAGSRRSGCGWIRTMLKSRREPEAALEEWAQWVEEEKQANYSHPSRTRPAFATVLMEMRADLLLRLDRKEDLHRQLESLIAWQRGQTEPLSQLITWLTEREAYAAIAELTSRFAPQIDQEPLLIYKIAEAQRLQGNADVAKTLAAQAQAKLGARDEEHVVLAMRLEEAALFHWAEQEYQYAIEDSPSSRGGLYAPLRLSEMLHDQTEEDRAAEVLRELVDLLENRRGIARTLQGLGLTASSTRSRLAYFEALGAASRGEYQKQQACLERALEFDPHDADALIAMYRLQAADRAFQARTSQRVAEATKYYEQQIEQDRDDPVGYNQLAWLIGNTTGDFDQALAAAQRAVAM